MVSVNRGHLNFSPVLPNHFDLTLQFPNTFNFGVTLHGLKFK